MSAHAWVLCKSSPRSRYYWCSNCQSSIRVVRGILCAPGTDGFLPPPDTECMCLATTKLERAKLQYEFLFKHSQGFLLESGTTINTDRRWLRFYFSLGRDEYGCATAVDEELAADTACDLLDMATQSLVHVMREDLGVLQFKVIGPEARRASEQSKAP